MVVRGEDGGVGQNGGGGGRDTGLPLWNEYVMRIKGRANGIQSLTL